MSWSHELRFVREMKEHRTTSGRYKKQEWFLVRKRVVVTEVFEDPWFAGPYFQDCVLYGLRIPRTGRYGRLAELEEILGKIWKFYGIDTSSRYG